MRYNKFGAAGMVLLGALGIISIHAAAQAASSAEHRAPPPPPSVRLYVFDGGVLHVADVGRFRLKKDEVSNSDLSVACFLIVHPKGTLMWDACTAPDSAWTPTGAPVNYHIVLPDTQQRDVTVIKPLLPQLAGVGYAPSDITFFSLSHFHYDHTGNANAFAGSTWLVRQNEHDTMFGTPPTSQPSTYAALKDSKTVIIKTDDYDVFGDGAVVIKTAPGHTVGHQVLYVKLAKTGPVVLSGDLWHYPEERALQRIPTIEFDQEETRSSRVAMEAFLKKSGAQLWIQHDIVGNAKLKKAPAYYD